ncbi:MAG: TetR family transcriptional regulator [Victivallaceae bacterium]|nr:TetR family transcriptional regulator [Victivallaceae bacterium]
MALTPRQEEIIDAAIALIARGGIGNLTVKKLAEAIGVTEPAVYRHFQNKAEIIRTMIGRFDEAVPTNAPQLRGWEAIAAFQRGRFAQVAANPDLGRVMFAEEFFLADPEFAMLLKGMMHRHKEAIEKHLVEGIAAGELRSDIAPDMLFRILMGAVRLLIRQWAMSGGAFDLLKKGEELIASFTLLLKKN